MIYAAPMNLERLELTGPALPAVEGVACRPGPGFAQLDCSRSGTLVYVREKAARQTLMWLDAYGRTQPLRTTAAEYAGTVRFSPDGKRLAAGLEEGGNRDVWLYEWERDTMTRLTFAPGYDQYPVWTPDGKHIVFASTPQNLYWMRADGAGEVVRLTESKNPQIPYSFSPDGKRLVFSEVRPQTSYDLWTLPLEGAESDRPKPGKPEPFLVTPFVEQTPMISPDGKWLAYVSDESGNSEVYVRPFPGPGGKWKISTGGGYGPVWSRKAQELFYASDEGMMMVTYTANGEAFVASNRQLWAQKKDFGFFDLAPDGKRFVVVQPETPEQNGLTHVTFLLNFFDELKRKAPVRGH
jgi:serine/threonine-protein kinase